MFAQNSVRAKKHNIYVHIKPTGEANTSIRPQNFMACANRFTNDLDFVTNIRSSFNYAVRNTYIKKFGGTMNPDDFNISVRYNPSVDSKGVRSTTHRCVYNVIVNKQHNSPFYGYHLYIYFINLNEIFSCVQKPTHFVMELKTPLNEPSTDRRINDGQPAATKLSKPVGPDLPKGCQLMYKMDVEQPYFVATLDEASWLKQKKDINFKEVMVANVAGTLFEVVGEARVVDVDINDYTQNYIFKSKSEIPKGFKHQQYKVNKTDTVYSNMLIDDAVEGLYDMVGKKAGMLAVVIHRSFLGDAREVIYTEDPIVMKAYKDKFLNRRKI